MEINVTNLVEYKKDVMQGAIQILQEDERKCAENIGKSISPIITLFI